MDWGYLDFSQLITLHQANTLFATRTRDGMNTRCMNYMQTDRHDAGFPDHKHRLARTLIIAALYKYRWQMEQLFKWIKHFIGNSGNAVKTQAWCTEGRQSASNLRLTGTDTAVATYVKLPLLKNGFKSMPRFTPC